MAKILGVDIGSHAIKLATLETSFRSRDFGPGTELPLEGAEPAAALDGALTALAAARKFQADQVAVALPGHAAASQVLTLPFSNEKQIDQTLGFEVEGQMQFELDEIAFDHQFVGASEPTRSELLVGVAKRTELDGLLARLKPHGLEPRVLTLPALAWGAVMPQLAPGEDRVAVVDIGHTRTCIAIGCGAVGLEWARTFAFGGADLDRVLAAEFKVSAEEARSWKEKSGDVRERARTPDEEAAFGALRRGLAPLIRELRQTLRAHQTRFKKKVGALQLAGGTSQLRGIAELLSRELGLQVGAMALPTSFTSQGGTPAGALAWALAERAQQGPGGTRHTRFNLRKGDHAFRGDFDYLRARLGRLGAYAAILLLLLAGNGWGRSVLLESREKQLDDKLCEATQKVLGKCQKDFAVALSMMRGQNTPAASIPAVSATELLAELTHRVPTDGNPRITSVDVSLSRVRVRGRVDGFDAVEKLTTALKSYRCFQTVKTGKVEKDPREKDKVEFSLDIEVGCPSASQG